MNKRLWHLPWTAENVPHALVDIIRGCNVVCRSCYNAQPPVTKSLDEITRDFDLLLQMRKLHSVSIVGGEVLMHPALCEIIRFVRSRDVRVELFTNGVLLDQDMMVRLKEAGTDVIFLHIEPGQKRADLQMNASVDDIRRLVSEKTALVAKAGVDVGLAMTVYEDGIDEMVSMIRFALESEHITYFLVTLPVDISAIEAIRGDLKGGLTGKMDRNIAAPREDKLTNDRMMKLIERELDLLPFAYVGSNVDIADHRWLSYVIGTIHAPGQRAILTGLKPSFVEKLYLRLYHLAAGRYPFYQKQNPALFRIQLLLNAVMGGFFLKNIRFLLRSLRPGVAVRYKKLLFQKTADIDSDGNVIHCRNCPDAVIKKGRLVPVCISDKVL